MRIFQLIAILAILSLASAIGWRFYMLEICRANRFRRSVSSR